MPAWVLDEELWEKAKEEAGTPKSRYKSEPRTFTDREVGDLKYPDEDAYWATVTHIYKNMGGRIKGQSEAAVTEAKRRMIKKKRKRRKLPYDVALKRHIKRIKVKGPSGRKVSLWTFRVSMPKRTLKQVRKSKGGAGKVAFIKKMQAYFKVKEHAFREKWRAQRPKRHDPKNVRKPTTADLIEVLADAVVEAKLPSGGLRRRIFRKKKRRVLSPMEKAIKRAKKKFMKRWFRSKRIPSPATGARVQLSNYKIALNKYMVRRRKMEINKSDMSDERKRIALRKFKQERRFHNKAHQKFQVEYAKAMEKFRPIEDKLRERYSKDGSKYDTSP